MQVAIDLAGQLIGLLNSVSGNKRYSVVVYVYHGHVISHKTGCGIAFIQQFDYSLNSMLSNKMGQNM